MRLVGNYLEVAHEYNKKATRINKTAAALDVCWGLLDCFYAVAQGVGDGVANIAHMVMHPIDTAISMAQGAFMIVDALVRLEVLGDQYEFNEKLAEHNAAHYTGMIDAVVEVIKEQAKDLKPRDIIRGATACATDWYLFGKALLATEMLYKKAKDKVIHLAQKAGEILSKESVILKTAEGFEAKIGRDVAENLSKMAAEHVASGGVEKISKSASIAAENFSTTGLSSEIGNLSKLEEAIKLFKETKGFLAQDGSLDRILKCGKSICSAGELATARGAMYEIEKAMDLIKVGEDIVAFGSKRPLICPNTQKVFKILDIDIETVGKFIECKKCDWSRISSKRQDELISHLVELDKLARQYGKIFELHSMNALPDDLKNKLIKKCIQYFDGK